MKYKFSDNFEFMNKTKHPAKDGLDFGKYQFFTSSNNVDRYCDYYDFDGEFLIIGDGGAGNCKYINDKFSASDHNYVIKSKGNIPAKLCYYFLCNHNYEILNSGFKGVGLKNISKNYISDINININGNANFNDIIVNLDDINKSLSNNNTILSEIDELVKSRFIEMFGDVSSNSKKWESGCMGDYLSLLTDFSSNGSYKTLDSNVVMKDEVDYAWMVRTTDLESNDFVNVKYIDEKTYNFLSKSKIYGDEIIMCKIGSAGKIYLMPKINKPASLGRNAFMFRYNEKINRVYMFYYLNTEYGSTEIMRYVRGAVTKTITKDDARAIRVIVPPIDLQNDFAAFVEECDKLKFVCQMN